jgi:hypothetical protein
MRGSSGLVFSKMNAEKIRAQFKEMNVEMVILQLVEL